MVASLPYTVLAQLLAPGKVSPLPPNAWFIVVLVCMVPAATIGALLVNWSTKWGGRETLNRFLAGLGSVLAVLGIVELAWQSTLQVNAPGLQLFVLLLFAAVAAYFGISPNVSNRILSTVRWGMRRRSLRQLTIGGTLVAGGILGFFLAAGSSIGLFTVLAVVFGMLVMVALALRVDSLIKQNVP
jgi:hypothetical protein